MAGTYGLTGTLTPVASASTQYLWGVVSGDATSDGVLTWIDVTFDAAASAQGIRIELFRATGGIPTNYTYTANRLSADAQTAPGTTSWWTTSIGTSTPMAASPTGVTIIKTWYYNPTGGALIQYPLGREDYMLAGTTNWVGLRIVTPTLASPPNCAYNASWNELSN